MILKPLSTALVLVCLMDASTAFAQARSNPWDAVQHKLRAGDIVTIRTVDHRQAKGRFVAGGHDGLVVSVDHREVTFPWASIDRVSRKRKSAAAGAMAGAAAGTALELPSARSNQGDRRLAGLTVIGAAAGKAIDGLFSVDRTVYRRR